MQGNIVEVDQVMKASLTQNDKASMMINFARKN